MPIPLLVIAGAAIATALEGVTIGGLIGAASATVTAAVSADAIVEWWDSSAGAAMLAEQLNKRLAEAGIDLEFPPFNPLFESGREVFKKTIEAYALDRLNAKAGTEFAKISDLTPDNFTAEISRVLAAQVNNETGSNLGAVWPVEKLRDQLHTEVMRQFDNRGRYTPGSLFAAGTLDNIKAGVAAKHPELMAAVPAPGPGGAWGPPRNEQHAIRREKARIRQAKYRRTHQQVWKPK